MIRHTELSGHPLLRQRILHSLIRQRRITLGGHRKLKIYGRLSCSSGKQMKAENRVFFATATEAIHAGYRPCGHCMPAAYQEWKMNA
ncbi:Ada metal-binding domain-containing protein [uncultured Chitinophaga sp.]|jgi:Adenosine deaminase|uniref:Ada metal-binding domain-containing protein n=1 Tax=uncultured Chitinophaga sp. TaxID=339340 RepID=UPI002624E1AA|nr:Ada metal-binding domain-containing protein [uncultured Chitinophaga sp.]